MFNEKSYMQIYCKINKERLKTYRKSHREEINIGKKKYYQTFSGRLHKKVELLKYKLGIKDFSITIIQQIYEDNIKKFGTLTCYLCLKPIEFGKDTLEHKIPSTRGGSSAKENLDVACNKCNASKKNKTVEEYNKWKEFTNTQKKLGIKRIHRKIKLGGV